MKIAKMIDIFVCDKYWHDGSSTFTSGTIQSQNIACINIQNKIIIFQEWKHFKIIMCTALNWFYKWIPESHLSDDCTCVATQAAWVL